MQNKFVGNGFFIIFDFISNISTSIVSIINRSDDGPKCKKMKLKDTADALFGKHIIQQKENFIEGELASYILEPVISRLNNPLQWWKLHSTKYPILAQVAKKILAIQATSTPSERLWSKAGELCNAKRSQLGAKLIDKILFCNHNKNIITC